MKRAGARIAEGDGFPFCPKRPGPVRGQNDTIVVAQASSAWFDLGDVEDLVFFLDVRPVAEANNKRGPV